MLGKRAISFYACPIMNDSKQPSVAKIIAKAIKAADKSYFMEDYDQQAAKVMQRLKDEGWAITKREADMEIFKSVADNMTTGRMKPEEHIRDVYHQVLDKLKA
jgi:glutamine synthetase